MQVVFASPVRSVHALMTFFVPCSYSSCGMGKKKQPRNEPATHVFFEEVRRGGPYLSIDECFAKHRRDMSAPFSAVSICKTVLEDNTY